MIHNQKMKSTAALCCFMAISAITPASAAPDEILVSGLQELPPSVLAAVSGAVEIHDEASTGGFGYNLTGAFGTAGSATLTNSTGNGGVFAINASAASAVPISLTVVAGAKLFIYVDNAMTDYHATSISGSGAVTVANGGKVIVGALPATIAVPA